MRATAICIVIALAFAAAGCASPNFPRDEAGGRQMKAGGESGVIFGRVLAGPGSVSHYTTPRVSGVAGQRVDVVDQSSGKTVSSAVTDNTGEFRIRVPAGSYVLKGVGVKRFVSVKAGAEVQADLALPVP